MLQIAVVCAFCALAAALLSPCIVRAYGSIKRVLFPTLIGSAILNALYLGVLAVCHATSKGLGAMAFGAMLLSALSCFFSCMFL